MCPKIACGLQREEALQQTCSRLLAWVALPCRCSFEGGRSPGACPLELGRATPERARCSSTASIVSPVCTVPPEKLGAVCSGPVTARVHSAQHCTAPWRLA